MLVTLDSPCQIQRKTSVKELYKKYQNWLSQAAGHFKARELELLERSVGITRLQNELEDARLHPRVIFDATQAVLKAKTLTELIEGELEGQKELKRPVGDPEEPTQPVARPQEFLLATSYDSRDPRLQRQEAAAGGGATEDRQHKRQRCEQATQDQDLSWDNPDWAGLLEDEHLAWLPAPSTPPLSQPLAPQDLQDVTAIPLTLSEEETASKLEETATKVAEWVDLELFEDDVQQQKEK